MQKRLSVTHNGFLEIISQNPQKTLTQRVVQTLVDHELVRKLIPEGSGSLMKAISDQLYFSTQRDQEIQQKCIAYAKNIVDSKTIPKKLNILKNSLSQYSEDPSNIANDTLLNCSQLSLGEKFDENLLNIDYENYLEDISRRQDDENLTLLEDVQTNNQAGYNLFENNVPPELFNVILDQERRNSIVQYVRHKKSTIYNASQIQNIVSPNKQEPEVKKKLKKKGVGLSLAAVRNRLGSQDNEESSENEGNNQNKKDKIIENQDESTNSLTKNTDTKNIDINLNQDEDYNLIQEAINLKRSRQESAISYNGGDLSNSSLSNQASFMAFPSAQNLGMQSNLKHCNSNPQINFPGSRSHSSESNRNDPTSMFNGIHNKKLGGIIIPGSHQPPVNQNLASLKAQNFHPQGIYSMNDLNTVQQRTNKLMQSQQKVGLSNLSKESSPPPGIDANSGVNSEQKRKHQVIESSIEKYQGTLKFFDQEKNYGFIVEDESRQDVFVHQDDLQKAGINKNWLMDYRFKQVRFQFGLMDYVGKYKNSRKAIDIQLLSDTPPFLPINPNQFRPQTNDQYLAMYGQFYGSGELAAQQGYLPSQYPAFINHPGMMANAHMMSMQPPHSPTKQGTAQFPQVMHYGMNVPPSQIINPQQVGAFSNSQVQSNQL